MNTEQFKIEETQYDFLSPDVERPTNFIRRFQQGKNRFYYTLDEQGKVTLYSSGTTLIKDGYASDSIALEEWRNRLRAEGKDPIKELNYTASRGTIMHFLIGRYIQGDNLNLNELDITINEKAPDLLDIPYFNEILENDIEWLQKALLAFAQFAKDYNVKPLALELIMKSDKYKVASPIDMICELDVVVEKPTGVYKSGEKKGQPKMEKHIERQIAIVDFKSTQSGFYDSHYLQLQLYKRLVAENYPNLNVEGLYNWSPKDWRKSPTYNFKDQSNTDNLLGSLCEVVYQQGAIKHGYKEPMVKSVEGEINISNYNGESKIIYTPLVEFLERFHKK